MASKKNVRAQNTKAKTAEKAKTAAKALKAAKAAKADKTKAAPVAAQGPRHPRGRVVAAGATKEALAKTLAALVARSDEDTDALQARLGRASNQQLLRLQRATETVKQKYGNRDKLIAKIGDLQKKSKDKDYLAKLDKYSLPQLLDLAQTVERRARAAA